MITNLFKTQTPIALFALPIVALICALPVFWFPSAGHEVSYVWMTQMFAFCNQHAIVLYLTTVVMAIGNALLFNFAFNRGDFFGKNSYLPGVFYLFGLFAFDEFIFSSGLVAHFFVIVGFYKLVDLRRQEESKDLIFRASLALGMAIFLKPLFLPIILLPWLSLAVFRPFVWREYFVVLPAILLPTFVHICLHFFVSGTWYILPEDLALQFVDLDLNLFHYLQLGLFLILLLYSVWKYFVVNNMEVVRFKKLSRLIFHFFWISSVIVGGEYYLYQHLNLVIFLPIAVIMSVAVLHTQSSVFINILVILWFISSGLKLVF